MGREVYLNRRDFFKTMLVAAGALAAVALNSPPIQAIAAAVFRGPVQLALKDRALQGTRDGQVLVSTDAGKTWQKTANFGSHCAVLDLVERNDLIYARVGLQQYSFVLQSADGRTWRTAPSIPA
jgi:hypothetical protein